MRTRVLVVQPSAAMRRVVVDVLETNGYAALGSDGAADARAVASAERPDIAIVADCLRDGGSAELVRFLRNLPIVDGRPVLVVAAVASRRAAQEFVGAGAHCTIERPICERGLLTALRWLNGVNIEANSRPEQMRPKLTSWYPLAERLS